SSSFWGVQIFCHRADSQVYADGTYSPAYTTAKMLCPDTAPTTSSYGGAFSDLDKKYLCSGLLPPTTTSYRIEGLQNGITYGVGVAAIDKFGNISAIYPADVHYAEPIPTVDFYSEYRNVGGTAQGGFCNLASQHGRPGMATILCLVGVGLLLGVRRQSKRRPPGTGTLVVLIAAGVLTAGQAHATGAYLGPTILEEDPEEEWHGSPREYAIEMRFGLYRPNIDSEFSGKGDKPQAYIFGNKRRPMWQMELDWEFLQEFGTLSLGGVIGYYKENARACTQAGLDATPPSCVRSGDNTGLRLIPLAVLLVYRMDEAARRWNIPLVPYAKIGLNYTIWTVTNGDGNVASAPGGGHGQGGTMGWQASVGLALQLDFLDPSASRGFDADTGVNHTYAFFELDHINSSGLYRKDVLRVGDDTWFAGLMFEF
ncbi:MAG TPA: MXAN_2562 family outer membrane beta-barrel protein, partial [Polyangia bacterium]